MTLTPATADFPWIAVAIVLAVLVVIAALVWMYRHHSTTVADLAHRLADIAHVGAKNASPAPGTAPLSNSKPDVPEQWRK